jgi:hypothetical protein
MITYIFILLICLAGDLTFNIWYIDTFHTMPFGVKLLATGISVLFIGGYSIIKYRWRGLILWPATILFWALMKDATIGLWFHQNIFYLSETTQPDRTILVIANNGILYTLFKLCAFGVFFGLIRHKYYERPFEP